MTGQNSSWNKSNLILSKKKQSLNSVFSLFSTQSGNRTHTSRGYTILSRARLPVPPSGHFLPLKECKYNQSFLSSQITNEFPPTHTWYRPSPLVIGHQRKFIFNANSFSEIECAHHNWSTSIISVCKHLWRKEKRKANNSWMLCILGSTNSHTYFNIILRNTQRKMDQSNEHTCSQPHMIHNAAI